MNEKGYKAEVIPVHTYARKRWQPSIRLEKVWFPCIWSAVKSLF